MTFLCVVDFFKWIWPYLWPCKFIGRYLKCDDNNILMHPQMPEFSFFDTVSCGRMVHWQYITIFFTHTKMYNTIPYHTIIFHMLCCMVPFYPWHCYKAHKKVNTLLTLPPTSPKVTTPTPSTPPPKYHTTQPLNNKTFYNSSFKYDPCSYMPSMSRKSLSWC